MLKPKGNGISPEGWQGKHNNSAKPPYLPYHYAVSFWWGGAVAVRLNFATFLFFFGTFSQKFNLASKRQIILSNNKPKSVQYSQIWETQKVILKYFLSFY